MKILTLLTKSRGFGREFEKGTPWRDAFGTGWWPKGLDGPAELAGEWIAM